MQNLIKEIKDFKIIPANFQSSSTFKLTKINEDNFEIKLDITDLNELMDYKINSTVEIFGVNNTGLVYFETKILDKKENMLTIELTEEYSIIQRREYSRVNLAKGKITFDDMPENFVEDVCDISAGGIKFIANNKLNEDTQYAIKIKLSNNMSIECSMQPIRIIEENGKYIISGKFIDIENSDRIILIQYAFKIKMENQKDDNE